MVWSDHLDSGIVEKPNLSRTILIHWIILPELVIVCVYAPYARLDNGVTARKARKLRHIYRHTFKGMSAHPSCIDYGVIFGVADNSQLLFSVLQDVLIIVNASR